MRKRFAKRIFSLILSLSLIVTMIPAEAFATAEVNEPELLGGAYQLKTKEDLYWFAALVNGTLTEYDQNVSANAVLCNDITVNKDVLNDEGDLNYKDFEEWIPIGNDSYFKGSFDGKGYTISGLYSNTTSDYTGLFGKINAGTIKNLTIKDSYFESGKYAGGIVGYPNSSSVKLEYCTNKASVKGLYAGGIAGYAGTSVEISNCVNHGSIVGTNYAGGIAGYANNSPKISNCINYGSAYGKVVGGIVGSFNTEISNCVNYGSIVGTECAGGIGGQGTNSQSTILDCINDGPVTGRDDCNTGGIVGEYSDCKRVENRNRVTGESGYTGGIIGYASTDHGVIYSSNKGDIKGIKSGGISGYSGSIRNSYNIGTVQTGKYITCEQYVNWAEYNNYYDSSILGISSVSTDEKFVGIAKTTEQFRSGEVAFLMGSADNKWKQNLGENSDEYPTIDQSHRIVYKVDQYDCDGQVLKNATYKNNVTPTYMKHSYGTPEWTWSSSFDKAYANFVCSNYSTHVAQEEATISIETKDATCVKKGQTIYTALVEFNGNTYVDSKVVENSLGQHKWESFYTIDEIATCSKNGSKSYHCEVCDTINSDSIVVIEKLPHNYNQKLSKDEYMSKAPTCTENAWYAYSCVCGEAGTDNYYEEDGSALGHKYDHGCDDSCNVCGSTRVTEHNWKAATCTEAKTCANCGETEGSELGHNWKAATCTEAKTCYDCGSREGSSLGHNWKAATCTEAKTCSVCGATEGSALGHNWKAATCIEAKMCSVCGVAEGSALGHNWKAATCTEAKTCENCGETEGSALGHNWKAATCTEAKTCENCGETEGNALGHSWKAATCTEAKTCTVCGSRDGNELGHNWKAATCMEAKICLTCLAVEGIPLGHSWKAATCTEAKTCSACGKIEGNALGHNWKAATCTEAKTCSVCGKAEGNALGHNWKVATCTEAKVCQDCGSREGSALGHNWKAATCTEAKRCSTCFAIEGSPLGHNWKAATCTEAKKCLECGIREGSALGHDWKAATCTEAKVCQDCGSREGSALGHNWKEATCTEAKICQDCGSREGSALGHNWKEATCTTPKICIECCEVKGIALGHQYSGWVIDNAATCTKEGKRHKTCVCGDIVVEVIPEKGHNWNEYYTIEKAATCEKDGIKKIHCSNCDMTKDERVIPASGHREVIDSVIKATFTEEGLTEGKHCSRCDKVLCLQEVIPAISTVKLSYTTKVYTGETIGMPKLKIVDTEGENLVEGRDYTVTGLTAKKEVGRYKVTVTLIGNYEGIKNLYFTIVPKVPASASATLSTETSPASGRYDDIKFSWKVSTGATGYLVYYKKTTSNVWSSPVATTKTFYTKKNLSDGIKYNFKVIPYYKTSSGTTKYYSSAQYRMASAYTLKKLAAPTISKNDSKVKVKWVNINGESGYQISKSTSKTGTNIVSTYATTTGTSKLISAIKGKTYYYKVRAYKTVNKIKVYGPWSAVKAFAR